MNFIQHACGWFADGYRITETHVPVRRDGVLITSVRYHACARVAANGRKLWTFAGKKAPYLTFEAAVKACAKHRRLWEKLVALSTARGNRLKRLEQIVTSTRPRKTKRWRVRKMPYLNATPLAWPPADLTFDVPFMKLLARAKTNVLAAERQLKAQR